MNFGELKKLIELSRNAGATEFTLGDLKIVFGSQTTDLPLTPTVSQTKATEVQTKVIEQLAFAEASRAYDEDALALMQIEDPVMFEQLMLEGELGNDGNGSELAADEQSRIDASIDSGARAQTPQH